MTIQSNGSMIKNKAHCWTVWGNKQILITTEFIQLFVHVHSLQLHLSCGKYVRGKYYFHWCIWSPGKWGKYYLQSIIALTTSKINHLDKESRYQCNLTNHLSLKQHFSTFQNASRIIKQNKQSHNKFFFPFSTPFALIQLIGTCAVGFHRKKT